MGDDHEIVGFRITSKGWRTMIKMWSFALKLPCPSDDVLDAMTHDELVAMGQGLARQVDTGNAEQSTRAQFVFQQELGNSL